MDPASLLLILVVIVVIAGIGFVLFGVGASQWKKQTDPSESEPRDDSRPDCGH